MKERNFHGAGVSGTVAVTGDAEGVRQIRSMQEEFSGNGDTHRARIRFDQDGAYEWSLEITDLAGNSLERSFHTRFVIDQTAPRIQIRGVEGRLRQQRSGICPDPLSGSAAQAGELRGRAFKSGGGTVGTRGTGDGRAELCRRTGVLWRMIFSYGPETDGMYCLRVWAGDLAGNFEERQLLFSVNRYGSVYLARGRNGAVAFPGGWIPSLSEGGTGRWSWRSTTWMRWILTA